MSSAPQFTFPQFLKKYPTDEACMQEIFDRVYEGMECCPECGKPADFSPVKGRKAFACKSCSHQLYPLAQTPLKDTKLPITNWFYAIFMFTVCKNGISAKELQRQLGVSYPTAHRMGHKVREMMNDKGEVVLEGRVEMDESLFKARKEWAKPNTKPADAPKKDRHAKKKRGWGSDQQCVFGMVERGGKSVTIAVPNRKAKTLLPIIVNYTTEDITANTDEFKGYNKLYREVECHQSVNHGNYEWVAGENNEIHTQTIEGHWSLLKRSIRGTHTSVSRKYLQNYLNEYDFRRNHRDVCLFDAILSNMRIAS